MKNLEDLKAMALHITNRTAPAEYTVEDVKTAFAGEIEEMAGSINKFMKNKYDLYEIVIETADEIIPKKAISVLGQFSEIRVVPQGQRAMFKRGKLGRNRAKKFLTQVGLSGVYESFRLDTDTFEVRCHAVGGAARIDFERFISGAENINELMDIVYEGLEEALWLEIQKALKAAIRSQKMPGRNKYIGNEFSGSAMQKIIGTVKAYGTDAVIFAAPEFVEAMGPDAIVPAVPGAQAIYHPEDIDSVYRTGRVKIFRGTPIVEIPQSFVDDENDKVYIDPSFAYILPAGGEKVVKVVFEGPTQVYDYVGRDQSIEINVYKRIGIGILAFNNWGIYQNTSLVQDGVYGPTEGSTGSEVPVWTGDKITSPYSGLNLD